MNLMMKDVSCLPHILHLHLYSCCCWGHELLTERCGRGLMECVPCREGYFQCDFTNASFPVKCYRIACPEMEAGVTVVRLTWNEDNMCSFSCVCNEATGHTGTTANNCSLHKHACGVDRELRNGSCVPCDKGYHNADPKFGRCVPDDSKAPTTQQSSSTTKSHFDSATETSHPPQDIPTMKDKSTINTVAVVVVVAFAAIAIAVIIACIKSGKINIACCGWAIQDSSDTDLNTADHLPNGTTNCRHSADDGSCPNGSAGGQSNVTTGHQHPNGSYRTPTGGQLNGYADGQSTDAQTDGTISSSGRELSAETWTHSLDQIGTIGDSEDPNRGTASSSFSRQGPSCGQEEYSIRALPQISQAPQHGQDIPMHDADTDDEPLPSNLFGSSLSELTTRSADVHLAAIFDPEETKEEMPLSCMKEVAVVSCEVNETHQPLLDNNSSQAFGELDINRY